MNKSKAFFWNIIIRATGSILGTLLFDLIARSLFHYDEKLQGNPVLLWAIRFFVFFLCYLVLRLRDGRRLKEERGNYFADYGEEESEYDEAEYAEEYEEEYVREEFDYAEYEDGEGIVYEEYPAEDCGEEYEEEYEEYIEEEEYEADYEEEYCEEEEYEDDEEEYDEEYEDDTDDAEYADDDIDEYREEITEMTDSVKVIFRQRNSIMLQAQKMMQSGNGSVVLEMAMHENNEKCGRTSEEIQKLLARLSETRKGQEVERILYNIQKHLDVVRGENQRVLSQINHLLVKQKEQIQEEQMREEASFRGDEETDESLFRGCKDKESLSKRYRNLMKTFHPDNACGDEEMTRKIQRTYEELSKKYQ